MMFENEVMESKSQYLAYEKEGDINKVSTIKITKSKVYRIGTFGSCIEYHVEEYVWNERLEKWSWNNSWWYESSQGANNRISKIKKAIQKAAEEMGYQPINN